MKPVTAMPKDKIRPFGPGLDWRLPTTLDRLVGWLVKSLGFAAFAMMVAGCMLSFASIDQSLAPLGLLLPTFVVLFTIAVHEAGHVIAARATGMTVTAVRVGPLELLPDGKGWRWRRTSALRTMHGAVIAYPHPAATIRRQRLWMISGGPVANIVLGLLGCLAGYLLLWHTAGVFLMTVAGYNLFVGALNLFPREGIIASDGLQLMRWRHAVDESDPRFVYERLVGMSLVGVPIDQMPQDQMAALAVLPEPMPLIHLWFRVKDLQEHGEWNEVARLLDSLIQLTMKMQPAMAKAMVDVVALIRCEIDFSRAMAGESLRHPIDQALTRDCHWSLPSLRPRCQALQAALVGDKAKTSEKLAESEAWVRRSCDRSLGPSEAGIRAAIRSVGSKA